MGIFAPALAKMSKLDDCGIEVFGPTPFLKYWEKHVSTTSSRTFKNNTASFISSNSLQE